VVSRVVVSVRNINRVLHVIKALIWMQKINFYLFRFFALVKPHPLCLGALRGKRLDTDRKVEWG